MPVFVKSGSIVPTRTGKVTNDVQNPLTKATLTIAQGASGKYDLYEDNGTTTKASDSATTGIRYTERTVPDTSCGSAPQPARSTAR
ncbi:DUF5110 domain-containing protein [Streptomyces phaeochromogenes]|uniref:DUF5110 domain-containing protein n=1 Tax=Streptomyces phaeochromogenes TaxID=1923 RepID=UPI0036BEDE48